MNGEVTILRGRSLEGWAVKILAILVLSSNLKVRRAISSITYGPAAPELGKMRLRT